MSVLREPVSAAQRDIKASYFRCLDGLRGIAAILVVAWHIGSYFQVPFAPAHAYLAVDFFFMLSGFVISYAYDGRLRRSMSLGDFVATRLIRLYPLTVAGVAMGSCAWLLRLHFVGDVTLGSILVAAGCNALLLPTSALTYIRPFAFPINGPLWSLSAEMLINLVYAAGLGALRLRWLLVVAAAGTAILFIIVLGHGTLDTGFMWSDFALGLGRVVCPFTLGIVIQRFLAHVRRKTAWGHAASAVVVGIMVAPSSSVAYDLVAVLLLFPAVIGLGAHAKPSRWLDGLWTWLGALSYPLYVTHYPLVAVLSNAAHQRQLVGVQLACAAAACLVLTIVVGVGAGAVDIRIRRWLRHRAFSPLSA